MAITVKLSDKTIQEMSTMLDDSKRVKTPPYAKFQADDGDTVVTVYESGKAVFQGRDEDLSSRMWIEMERHNNPTKAVDVKDSSKKEDKKPKENKFEPKVYNFTTIG